MNDGMVPGIRQADIEFYEETEPNISMPKPHNLKDELDAKVTMMTHGMAMRFGRHRVVGTTRAWHLNRDGMRPPLVGFSDKEVDVFVNVGLREKA